MIPRGGRDDECGGRNRENDFGVGDDDELRDAGESPSQKT